MLSEARSAQRGEGAQNVCIFCLISSNLNYSKCTFKSFSAEQRCWKVKIRRKLISERTGDQVSVKTLILDLDLDLNDLLPAKRELFLHDIFIYTVSVSANNKGSAETAQMRRLA